MLSLCVRFVVFLRAVEYFHPSEDGEALSTGCSGDQDYSEPEPRATPESIRLFQDLEVRFSPDMFT